MPPGADGGSGAPGWYRLPRGTRAARGPRPERPGPQLISGVTSVSQRWAGGAEIGNNCPCEVQTIYTPLFLRAKRSGCGSLCVLEGNSHPGAECVVFGTLLGSHSNPPALAGTVEAQV